MRTRRLLAAALSLACAAAVAVAAAPDAAAAPVFHSLGFSPVLGDLTGDGVADRTTLGYFSRASGDACAYQLEKGLGHNTFAAPVAAVLPVRDSKFCPGLGTVVKGPTAAQNQLATAFWDFTSSIQLFRGFSTSAVRWTGGLDGTYTPFSLHSLDLDGDGWGDLYEDADTSPGFVAWTGRDNSWRQVFATPHGDQWTNVQFLDLDRRGGLDIIGVSGDNSSGETQASVTDGGTGATQVLADTTGITDANGVDFDVSVVDVDHDTLPDLFLRQTVYRTSGVTTTYRNFTNRSTGQRWLFKPGPVHTA